MTASAIPPAKQLAAIEASGWDRSFGAFQPHNLATWVFLRFLALGAITMFRWVQPGVTAVGTALTRASLTFALYGGIWLWFRRQMDRRVPIPARLLLYGSLGGGTIAISVIAVPGNDALLSIYTKTVSAELSRGWGFALAAPFTEEIGIMPLVIIAPRIIRLPVDGFIVGAFVGLGFQVVEDVLYVVNAAAIRLGENQGG
ncbi:MAG TPA: PrsW family glutamic-type intramembrane protease [Thermomicrobiales bacterium]|nr:PrsW family glutamic-type intramembrane protease [Thermomicrobiales bacterium]